MVTKRGSARGRPLFLFRVDGGVGRRRHQGTALRFMVNYGFSVSHVDKLMCATRDQGLKPGDLVCARPCVRARVCVCACARVRARVWRVLL